MLVFALWAFILMGVHLARLMLLSMASGFNTNSPALRMQLWLIVIMNIAFALCFGASTYGLWMRLNWGRLLFLGTLGVWTLANVIGLLAPSVLPFAGQARSTTNLLLILLRYGVGLVAAVLYLNLPHIKALFVNAEIEDT